MLTLQQILATETDVLAPPPECVICKKAIRGVHSDDLQMTSDGPVHEECHLEELRDVVEAHPPHGLRNGR